MPRVGYSQEDPELNLLGPFVALLDRHLFCFLPEARPGEVAQSLCSETLAKSGVGSQYSAHTGLQRHLLPPTIDAVEGLLSVLQRGVSERACQYRPL